MITTRLQTRNEMIKGLNELNEEQAKAVKKTDGPVMVIAGPGTGKTQILASRIAEILNTTDSHAQNILCLTYTDAGTVAMRQRLLKIIGNEAHRVPVHTFHSFCHRVIQENPEEFEYRNLNPAGDLDRSIILHDIAVNLEEDHPLKKLKGNVGYLLPRLAKLFEWMKKEHYSHQDIEAMCIQRKGDIRESDEYTYKRAQGTSVKGDLNMNVIGRIDAQLDDLIGGALLFDRYNGAMTKAGLYDYDDMILWVLELFSKSPAVLSSYQELFHYILVDEFQDTNGSQNELIEHMTSYWDNPNIFVVGDDDQSIYRFQGAELKNVMDFVDRHKNHLYPVVLTKNYRSTQLILNAAKCHIDTNKERLVIHLDNLDKTLESDTKFTKPLPVSSNSFQSEFQEAVWVSSSIKNHLDQGVDPDKIAVIYRNHKHGELLAELMAHRGLSVFFHKPENALKNLEVKKLLTVLTYVSAETVFPHSGENLLFEMMHQLPFNLKPITNARVARYVFKNRSRWREFFSKCQSLDLIESGFDESEITEIQSFGDLIEEFLLNVHQRTLLGFVDFVIVRMKLDESNALDTFSLECIRTFLEYVQAECYSNPEAKLNDLLEKLQLMDDQNIALNKERILYDRKGVQLMTAHGSKGLEFRHVYIINCSGKAWEKDGANKRPYGFINLFDAEDKESSIEENRRLFYVAMTRAQETLTMTHHMFDVNRKDVTRSSFVDHLSLEGVIEEGIGDSDPKMEEELLRQITFQPLLQSTELLDGYLIDQYLQTYQLSPSHLNAYLQCPTTFYFEQILRIPSAKNKYMSFGTAVHRSLDQLIKVNNSSPQKFTSAHLRELYEFYLKRERYVFTQKEYEDFMSLGINVLTNYFDERAPYWMSRSDLRSEVVVDRVLIENVPVKGQMDLLDVEGSSVHVVDFKTGDSAKAFPRLKPPRPGASDEDGLEARHGGSYWRQMMFYALLIKNNKVQPLNMQSGTFEFIEPDKNQLIQQKKIVIQPEGLQHMKQLITEVYNRINHHDFLDGCGESDCRWCTFVSKIRNKYDS